MGNSATPGLTKRGGIWYIDKQYRGVRICDSSGTGSLAIAQEHLAKRMNDIREAQLYGVRESHTFRTAATKFLEDFAHKKSVDDDAIQLEMLSNLIAAADKICESESRKPPATPWLRRRASAGNT